MNEAEILDRHFCQLRVAYSMMLERETNNSKRQYLRGVMEGLRLSAEALLSCRELTLDDLFTKIENACAGKS